MEAHGLSSNQTVQRPTKGVIAESISKLIAADAVSLNFEPEQSVGKILADFLPAVLEGSPSEGFSKYLSNRCHESVHGRGTCSKALARDNSCTGDCFRGLLND